MKKVNNYVKLRGGILYDKYMFYDVSEYYADVIFINNKIHVKFGKEYKHPYYPYHAIFCKVRKKDSEVFRKSMGTLIMKMLTCGHTDYIKFCEIMQEEFEKGKCV